MRLKKTFSLVTAALITTMLLVSLPAAPVSADGVGPLDAGTAVSLPGAGVAWTNPGNVTSSGAPYAVALLTTAAPLTNIIQASNYGFLIPSDSTINGILVWIRRNANGTTGVEPYVLDSEVKLVKGGVIVGDNKAKAYYWPTTGFGTAIYGSETDLWGTTWTVADINSTGFGVSLSALKYETLAGEDRIASVDFMEIFVYYTLPATTTTVNCGSGTPVAIYGNNISCMATVTRVTGSNTPNGTVNWLTDGDGTFSPTACTLTPNGASAYCSVNYRPNAVGDGAHLITATYAGSTTFSGSSGSQTVTVNKRPITVTADAKTKIYGNTDPGLTYQVTSGSLAFSDTFSGALTRAPGEGIGYYAIQQGTLALSENYILTYVGANLTINKRPITVTADEKTKVYGYADPGLTYQITSSSLVFGDTFTGAIIRAAGENVGPHAIQQGTLALSENYNLTYVGANLNITARPVSVTADPKTKVYGEVDPEFTYQLTSGTLVPGDTFSGALSRAAGENVGNHAITQGTLTLGGNYNITYEGANLAITVRPITATADDRTKVYGDADPALTYQITAGSLAFTDAFTGAQVRVAGENVGTYAISQGTLALSANYNLTYVGGADLTITVRPITVTVDAKTKVYGEADPLLTYQITTGSLAFTDTFTGTIARVAGENVGTYPIGQGTLTLTANYNLTFVGANLVITVRPITVTADAQTKEFGAADPALTYQITEGSLAFSDVFTGALTRAPGEGIGQHAILQGTLALTNNYALTFVGDFLTITGYNLFIPVITKTSSE